MPKISKKARRKAFYDEKQYVLNPTNTLEATDRRKTVKAVIEFKPAVYYCPFCLYFGRIEEFEFKTPKGKPSKRMKCPDCNNTMLKRTLETKMNAEDYAIWCWAYSKDGFWQKCNFKVWKERLYKLGMARVFWAKYKQLKGPAPIPENETDEERFNREMIDAIY